MTKHARLGSVFYLPAALLCLGLACSCGGHTTSDPKSDLIASLKGANVGGYDFSLTEDEARTTATLTNKAVKDLITLAKDDAKVVLRYTKVQEKSTQATTTSKIEAVQANGSLALVTTDLATDRVLDQVDLPPPSGICPPDGQFFESLEACVADFNCKHRGALLCEANRTCKPQFAGLICCLTNGQAFSVHLVVPPTRLRCQIAILDFEGLVLSRD